MFIRSLGLQLPSTDRILLHNPGLISIGHARYSGQSAPIRYF